MKLNKIIQISFKRFCRNKKRNMIIIVPLTIMIIILTSINMIQYSIKNYIKNLEQNIEMRTIEGITYVPEEYANVIEQLHNIEHIDMIASEIESWIYAEKKCDEIEYMSRLSFEPVNNKVCPEVLKGRKIEDKDEYVIVLPNKIYNTEFGGYSNNSFEIYNNPSTKYLNGEDFLGKNLTIEFTNSNGNKTLQNFKVIGIYDIDRYFSLSAFVQPKDIREINERLKYEINYYQINIVVDELNNLESVANQINRIVIGDSTSIQTEQKQLIEHYTEQELNMSSVTNISLETLEIIRKLIIVLIISVAIILITILIVSNCNKNYFCARELGILKVEGYTNSDIQKITIIENIIVCLFSIAIALLIFQIICVIGNIVIDYIIQKDTIGITMNNIKQQLYYIKLIPQKTNIPFIIYLSIIVIFIESINTFFSNKRIFSKNISAMLKC